MCTILVQTQESLIYYNHKSNIYYIEVDSLTCRRVYSNIYTDTSTAYHRYLIIIQRFAEEYPKSKLMCNLTLNRHRPIHLLRQYRHRQIHTLHSV